MGARGKKAASSLSVIKPQEVRPKPLPGLTKDQQNEWKAVVDRMPSDWFPRETHQLLAQYCRHVVTAQKISKMVERFEEQDQPDPGDYERLLKMQDREGRAMSSLATRMRISQQATYDKVKSKRSAGSTKKPWE